MVVVQKPVTAEELLAMPDHGLRNELVGGEARWMAPAGNVHGRIAVNVTIPLGQYVRENDLGLVFAAETGFKIASDPDTVRAPDVAFVNCDRVAEVGEVEGFWPGAPDLAVEVVSPNDLYTEVEEKVADWLDAGAGMVVVVNPQKQNRRRAALANRDNRTWRRRHPGRWSDGARLELGRSRSLPVNRGSVPASRRGPVLPPALRIVFQKGERSALSRMLRSPTLHRQTLLPPVWNADGFRGLCLRRVQGVGPRIFECPGPLTVRGSRKRDRACFEVSGLHAGCRTAYGAVDGRGDRGFLRRGYLRAVAPFPPAQTGLQPGGTDGPGFCGADKGSVFR